MIISPVSFKYTSNVSFGKKSTKEKKLEPPLGSPEYCAKKIIGGGSRFAIAVTILILLGLLKSGGEANKTPEVTTDLPSIAEMVEGQTGETAIKQQAVKDDSNN